MAVAEVIARRLGHGVEFGGTNCEGTPGAVLLRARDELHLDAKKLDQIAEQAKVVLAEALGDT